MQTKHKSFAIALGALLSAMGPAITHAESQQDWLTRQLQISDGYSAETPMAAKAKKADADASPMDSKAGKGAESDTGFVGTSKEERSRGLTASPKNYYNGFSPYASDPQYSP